MNLKDAQIIMIGIIESVEAGVLTPAEALKELGTLNKQAEAAGISPLSYTMGDFILIRENSLATYDDGEPEDDDRLFDYFVIDEEDDEL